MHFSRKVGPTEVLSLTDDEYNALGIEAIGKRVQLRQRCKDLICGKIIPFKYDHIL